ncbi:MAG TPA: tetratricopeptide repeat protein [Myxococcota bacterium]|nr:tetratricopeptide repeat protein [Myxococcota bacterium]HRY93469.1 tetratricopeptide repeat protein [Myxococcota bacterium]HSA23361.1 tetratricopeptide repeat protein [Myxococcota bacterium]
MRTHPPRPPLPLLLLALGAAGCLTPRAAERPDEDGGQGPPAREVVMEPLRIRLAPDPELGLTDFDASTLFHEGLRLQEAQQCEAALRFYDRLLAEFSDSRYLSAAAFNAGRCLETLGRLEEALARYRRVTEGLPRSKDWVDALFREAECLAALGRHAEAVSDLGRLLARADLPVSDRVDGQVLLGENHLARGDTLAAEQELRTALRLFRAHERDEFLDPAPAARAEHRLAELATARFEAAPLRPPEAQLQADLEAKAQLLLEAQNAYLRSMRYGDPDWATASGFRIGQLYLALHRAMEAAPLPEDLSPEEADLYRDLLRKRTAVLLRKALRVFEMTAQLGERTGTDNDWTRKVRDEMQRVEQLVLSQLEPLPEPPPPPPAEGPGNS